MKKKSKKRFSNELRILISTFIIGIVSMIGHNLFYALAIKFPDFKTVFDVIGVVLFFATLISALVFLLVIIYTGIKYLIKGKPKDAWHIGWIGLALLVFFLIVGMKGFYFYVFAIVLMLFFIPKIGRLMKGK